jgi:hypothetical protein
MIPGIIGFLFVLPFGIFSTSVGDVRLENPEDFSKLPILYWFAVGASIATYMLMLISLFYLKKTARHFLDNNLLKNLVIDNLSKNGKFLVLTAIGTTLSYILIWFAKIEGGTLTLQYGTNIFIPLFIAIVGLFFILIANTLNNARLLQEENDLTI